MKKLFWVSPILPWFMALCLWGCTSTPSPHDPAYPTAADELAYPKKIALLLPLQGELATQGNAVREGFFAAYYIDAKEHETGLPNILVIDTKNEKNILADYQRALAQGAEFIVGPLSKPALDVLLKAGNPRIPILALNTVETYSEPNMYQFGLLPENEAEQAAKRAYRDGHRKALLFVQQGPWGERTANAFKKAFMHEGGEVVQAMFFPVRANMSEVVKEALLLDAQEKPAQARALQQMHGVQFAMKPRSDVDMVFMAVMPVQARQIPPLLSFYYAGNWPIYATSSVYSGTPNPRMDSDLNGVTFCDIPWLIQTPQHNPMGTPDSAVQQLWPDQPRAQLRLYAMGVDAYEVIPRLPSMKMSSDVTFKGATGTLSLDDRQRIQRELPCTWFVDGVPVKTDD